MLTAAHATYHLHQTSSTYVSLLVSTSILKLLAAQGIYTETPLSTKYTCTLVYRVLLPDPYWPDIVPTKRLLVPCIHLPLPLEHAWLSSPLRSRQVERRNTYTLRRRLCATYSRSSLWCPTNLPSTTGVRNEAIYTYAFRNQLTDDLRDETFAWTSLQTERSKLFWKASAPMHEN